MIAAPAAADTGGAAPRWDIGVTAFRILAIAGSAVAIIAGGIILATPSRAATPALAGSDWMSRCVQSRLDHGDWSALNITNGVATVFAEHFCQQGPALDYYNGNGVYGVGPNTAH